MKVGIVGAGKMGSGFARCISEAGHEVLLTTKQLDHAETVAKQIAPKAKVVVPGNVGNGADIIILATPASESANALRACGYIKEKIILDIANPTNADMTGLTVGLTTSFAEELSRAFPEIKVVKAFNTVFPHILLDGPYFGLDTHASTFYCGDDEDAKKIIRQLIESMGFGAIEAGPLSNARYLEPMGMLMMWLRFAGGRGTDISLNLVTRTQILAKQTRAA